VRIVARGLEGGLEIRVEDEGPGIAEEDRERVFEKFYRGSDVRGRIAGTGLGLAIARGLVAAHGGTIRAEDAPTGGAALVVWIPPAAYRWQPALRLPGGVS
jgi:signal transduction histidine kinase